MLHVNGVLAVAGMAQNTFMCLGSTICMWVQSVHTAPHTARPHAWLHMRPWCCMHDTLTHPLTAPAVSVHTHTCTHTTHAHPAKETPPNVRFCTPRRVKARSGARVQVFGKSGCRSSSSPRTSGSHVDSTVTPTQRSSTWPVGPTPSVPKSSDASGSAYATVSPLRVLKQRQSGRLTSEGRHTME